MSVASSSRKSKVHGQKENFNKKKKGTNYKKNLSEILELKNTMNEMKNATEIKKRESPATAEQAEKCKRAPTAA